jgi:hypothetical protein
MCYVKHACLCCNTWTCPFFLDAHPLGMPDPRFGHFGVFRTPFWSVSGRAALARPCFCPVRVRRTLFLAFPGWPVPFLAPFGSVGPGSAAFCPRFSRLVPQRLRFPGGDAVRPLRVEIFSASLEKILPVGLTARGRHDLGRSPVSPIDTGLLETVLGPCFLFGRWRRTVRLPDRVGACGCEPAFPLPARFGFFFLVVVVWTL